MSENNKNILDEYKITELGILPKDWEIKKLSDIVDYRLGRTPPRKERKYWEKGIYPWVSIADMQREIIIDTKEKVSELAHEKIFKRKLVPSGTLLMSFKLTIGRTSLLGIDAYHNEAIISITPKDNVYQDYLKYFLPTVDFTKYQDKAVKGNTLNKSKIDKILIPLPPLPEQKAIAHVLQTVQEAKEKTEEVIRVTKELKKSMMKYLFTYGPVPLEEAENVRLKETEIGEIPEEWDKKAIKEIVRETEQKNPKKLPILTFKYIDVSSINRETLKIQEFQEINSVNAPSRARKFVKKHDVIFATVRPTLKRLALIDDDFDGEICSTAFCVLRPNEEIIDPLYLFYSLQRENFINTLGKIQKGANYPAVTDSEVKNQYIPFPSIITQRKIASILFSIDSKIEAEENKKKALDELFKTLLNDLMTAKIRVKNLEV